MLIVALLLGPQAASAYALPRLAARSRTPTMQYEVQAETVKVFGETKPYTFLTVQPTFTVLDWDRAKPILADYVATARSDFSCMYCGWSVCGDSLFGRVAHVDGAAVTKHIQDVGPCIDRLIADGVATLDEFSIHGPADELAKCRSAIDGLGSTASSDAAPEPPADTPEPGGFFAGLFGGGKSPSPPRGRGPNAATAALLRDVVDYYEIVEGISFITKEAGGVMSGQRLCSLQQTYTVSDWAEAKLIMTSCVEKAEAESNIIFFGWTQCGDQLFCRAAHASAKGVLKHIDNMKESMDNLTSVATLDRSQIHGPMAQNQLVKDSFKTYGFGGPKPKSQFDTLDGGDPRMRAPMSEAEEEAAKAELAAAQASAKAAADKVAFFNVDSGFQRFEAVRLGGFEQ